MRNTRRVTLACVACLFLAAVPGWAQTPTTGQIAGQNLGVRYHAQGKTTSTRANDFQGTTPRLRQWHLTSRSQ